MYLIIYTHILIYIKLNNCSTDVFHLIEEIKKKFLNQQLL